MKGAVGSAFLLNIVITFILIFYMLLISSMAYTKAYKVKNHIINSIDMYISTTNKSLAKAFSDSPDDVDIYKNIVNPYLAKVGYQLSNGDICKKEEGGYTNFWSNNRDYDYCLYQDQSATLLPGTNRPDKTKPYYERYMVKVYMKFDFPIIGDYIRIPITGETRDFEFYYSS